MVTKDELRLQFSKEWKKHYEVKALVDAGFKRQECKKCKRHFWAILQRETCADSTCVGYQFIGKPATKKKLDYVGAWKEIEKYFVKTGHTSIEPYPTVARWRDDLYFTIASINDFQPYVVNGEIEPPANPLIVPQTCIRFSDISNVGVTGRHYTNFVMIGQHAFNTKKTGLFYWKDEALSHDLGCMKSLGIPETEIVFLEDVWMGGGNFGPSMEYFVGGLELGNCVFMQYEITPSGNRELSTKVIDMGAGLSRFAWVSQGLPTSYEIVFGPVIQAMKKDAGLKIDESLLMRYSKASGILDAEDEKNIGAQRKALGNSMNANPEQVLEQLRPLHSLYASADHLCTVLFTSTDGQLPSNAGGGYNLRMILRRIFASDEEFSLNLDYAKILKGHADYLEPIFPKLQQGVLTTIDVVEEERKKYNQTLERGRGKVTNLVQRAERDKKPISFEILRTLYESDGIPPELAAEIAKEKGVQVNLPADFYSRIRKPDESVDEAKKLDLDDLEKTEGLYYSDSIFEFEAKISAIREGYIVLDKTAFYPEGGGQTFDSGTIDGEPIESVTKEAGVVLHKIKHHSKFKQGQLVHCKVNMQKRIQVTQHHTATHLVNAVCRQVLGPHVWQGGSHKDEEKAHLDITHYKKITPEEQEKIEQLVNHYITKNLPIKTQVLPRNIAEQKYGFRLYQGGAVPGKELRVVSIGDLDHEACGGTHQMLKHTGEIGTFKLLSCEGIQDGIIRVSYKCGPAAIKYIQERERLLSDAASIVSIAPLQLPATMKRFFEEWKERGKQVDFLSEKLAGTFAQELISEAKKEKTQVLKTATQFDSNMLKKICLAVSSSKEPVAILLYTSNKEVACAVGNSQTLNASEILSEFCKKHGGKGGGSQKIAFGRIELLP